MRWFGSQHFTSVLAFALAIAWLSSSNHCAWESILTPTVAGSAAHCPLHDAKSGSAAKSCTGMLACCKGLLSSALEIAKVNVDLDAGVAASPYASLLADLLIRVPLNLLTAVLIDTGPGKGFSFAESVLQVSLPVHAPPSHA